MFLYRYCSNIRKKLKKDFLETKKWRVFKPVATAPYKENHAGMRMSHTANPYKNGIIIFGGEKEYNTNMRARQCLSDVQVYNCGMQIHSYLLFISYQ